VEDQPQSQLEELIVKWLTTNQLIVNSHPSQLSLAILPRVGTYGNKQKETATPHNAIPHIHGSTPYQLVSA